MGEHESGPMTKESRLISLRQPSVPKKCCTVEKEREGNGPGQHAAEDSELTS